MQSCIEILRKAKKPKEYATHSKILLNSCSFWDCVLSNIHGAIGYLETLVFASWSPWEQVQLLTDHWIYSYRWVTDSRRYKEAGNASLPLAVQNSLKYVLFVLLARLASHNCLAVLSNWPMSSLVAWTPVDQIIPREFCPTGWALLGRHEKGPVGDNRYGNVQATV